MVHYKLFYFNMRGRAELIRFVFAAADQQYEDFRFEREQWPQYKPLSPTGQVPFLEVHDGSDTFILTQSVAIARYLAKKFNLAGKGECEEAEVDMYADQVSDLLNQMAGLHHETDETRKAELTRKLTEETLPTQLSIFESRLAKTGSGHLAASGLSFADLYLTLVVEWLGDKREVALTHFPHVKQLVESVNSHPKIAAWISKRPVSAM